jgi:hypothetical protein
MSALFQPNIVYLHSHDTGRHVQPYGPVPEDAEQLFDLPLDPNEMRNVASEPEYAAEREGLAGRLDAWMRATADPLLEGPVPAPAGARINRRDARSADEEPIVIDAEDPLAAVPVA